MAQPLKIAHVGNLANLGYLHCLYLRRKGVDAHLYIKPGEKIPVATDATYAPDHSLWVHRYQRIVPYLPRGTRRLVWTAAAPRLAWTLASYDVVTSWTSGLVSVPFTRALLRLVGKPYMAVAAGSDLRELALQDTRRGRQMARYYREAGVVVLGMHRMVEKVVEHLGLTRVRHNTLPVDVDLWKPRTVPRPWPDDQMVFLMPSHMDWGETDNAPGRNFFKNNDRFLRAFARFVHEGSDAVLIALDRGSDVALAKQLCAELGIANRVHWQPEVTQYELIDLINQVDVVADQFPGPEVGLAVPGMIGVEALACGKPLLIDVDIERNRRFYPEPVPALSCYEEDEIYRQIKRCQDPDFRQRIGQQAREWIVKYYHWEKVIDDWIEVYRTLIKEGEWRSSD